ncbi:MAG TPA: SIMPL domain-containing protein [Vicinamibacterales bacterium]|nr:SIMPL domain-containing protein [Vicinamibacterales bacterium]
MLSTTLLLLGMAAQVGGQPQVPPTPFDVPVVVATGEGVIKRAPDRAWVTVAAESRAKTPQEAQRLNAAAMTAVLDRLKSTGLPPDAVQTRSYDLQAEYDYQNNRQTLRGYLARNSVEIRVDALPRLGDIIDAAVGAGATAVSGIRFDLQDRANVERQALQRAVTDARERATAAASGAGMKVDRVLRIVEMRVPEVGPPRPMVAMREMAQAPSTPIEAGEIEIRAGVTLTATIRP